MSKEVRNGVECHYAVVVTMPNGRPAVLPATLGPDGKFVINPECIDADGNYVLPKDDESGS